MDEKLTLKQAVAQVMEAQALTDYVKHLPARDMRSDKDKLQTLSELGWLLYAKGEHDAAFQIAKPLAQVAFDGNYNRWTWLEHANVLLALTAPEEEKEAARQHAIHAIEQAVRTGDKDIVEVKKDVHKRFLNGDTLDTDSIQRSMDEGDRAGEAARRLILLKNLCKIELLGGSKAYSAERAAQEAEAQIQAIREIEAELGLLKLSPFA